MMSKFFSIIFLSLCVTACAITGAITDPITNTALGSRLGKEPCSYSEGVLKIRGKTNDKLLACIQKYSLTTLTTVDIRSPGGPVLVAMEIGDLIATNPPEVIVHKRCNSSCANYILPLARSITLSPNAEIILHGSIDDHALSRGTKPSVIARQREYALRHNIHPGWLLYRTQADIDKGGMGAFVKGSQRVFTQNTPIRYLLAEKDMIVSCLSGIHVTGIENAAAGQIHQNDKLRRRFGKRGVVGSGNMQCTQGDTYPIIPQ